MRSQQANGITWVDIENPTQQEIDQLAQEYQFHPLQLEDSLLVGALPQLEKEASYLFVLLHIPVLSEADRKIVAAQVAVFLGKEYLVTIHTGASPNVSDLFTACQHEADRRSAYFKNSAGYLLYQVLKVLLQDTSNLIKATLRELDGTEDEVFNVERSDAKVIAGLRQKILRLRRTMEPFKDLIADLVLNVHGLGGENLLRHYRDLSRRASWLFAIVEEAEKTVEIYKDADFTTSTERTNDILAVLTILFTLSIPATVLGAFYGMNVLLPGGIEEGPWRFFGDYTTLIIMVMLSIAPAVGMFCYFKKKHWF